MAASITRVAQELEQVHEMEVAMVGDDFDGPGVGGELLVVFGGIGQWRGKSLVRDGTEEKEADFVVPADGLDGVDEFVVIPGELRQPGRPGEGTGHPVAKDDDVGFVGGDLLLEAVKSLVDGVEARARFTERRVGAPAEVAEDDVAVMETAGEGGLDGAVALLAFDEGVADEGNTIAVEEFEFVGVGGEGGDRTQEQESGEIGR